MSLLISHFDIMGARSTMAAHAEKQRMDEMMGKNRFDISQLKDDAESSEIVRQQWMEQLEEIDDFRKQKEAERRKQEEAEQARRRAKAAQAGDKGKAKRPELESIEVSDDGEYIIVS